MSKSISVIANQNLVAVTMPPPGTESSGRINYFHRVTKEAGRISIAAAFYAGIELAKVKARIGHGEFQGWIASNCEFKYSTAHNYIHMVTMYFMNNGIELADMLDASDVQRQEAITQVIENCESNSLTEIYVDLGIVKKSKSNLGGKREGAGRPRKQSAEELAKKADAVSNALTAEATRDCVAQLYVLGVTQGGFGEMNDADLKGALGTLESVLQKAEEILKSRRSKTRAAAFEKEL